MASNKPKTILKHLSMGLLFIRHLLIKMLRYVTKEKAQVSKSAKKLGAAGVTSPKGFRHVTKISHIEKARGHTIIYYLD